MRKTVYSPEIGNPVYFDREARPSPMLCATAHRRTFRRRQAHNINVVLEALFASSSKDGAEVSLTA